MVLKIDLIGFFISVQFFRLIFLWLYRFFRLIGYFEHPYHQHFFPFKLPITYQPSATHHPSCVGQSRVKSSFAA